VKGTGVFVCYEEIALITLVEEKKGDAFAENRLSLHRTDYGEIYCDK
jgi:NADH:ubiquinone oxidoreductase subunit F (NADH-binding)